MSCPTMYIAPSGSGTPSWTRNSRPWRLIPRPTRQFKATTPAYWWMVEGPKTIISGGAPSQQYAVYLARAECVRRGWPAPMLGEVAR